MCGIVGYVGHAQASDLLLQGLHRLEYRGYDSAGLAVSRDGEISVRKKAGRVRELAILVDANPVEGVLGIGHTRWATHGETTDLNSHPHIGGNGNVVLVHNGVIENYTSLRDQLQGFGFVFRTTTDTEVIAHLIAHHWAELVRLGANRTDKETCVKAVEQSLLKCKGTYGLGILFRDVSDLLIAAKVGSPLVIGIGQGEYFLASDAGPLVGHTEEVVYLSDRELAVLTPSSMEVLHRDNGHMSLSIQTIDQVSTDIDLGDYPHYMLKEIFEQPTTFENAFGKTLPEALRRYCQLTVRRSNLCRMSAVRSGCRDRFPSRKRT